MKGAVRPTFLILALALLPVLAQNSFLANATFPGPITPLPNADLNTNTSPTQLVTSTGDVWVSWEKQDSQTTQTNIYLMIHKPAGWQAAMNLTTGPSQNKEPALAQLTNGTIILVWASNRCNCATGFDLYTKSNTGGVWSSTNPLVQATGDDVQPSLTRLIDGRVMLVWTRVTLTNGSGDLYYKILTGSAWAAEQQLTNTTTNEESQPSVTQTLDGRVWVAFAADYTFLGNSSIFYKTWNLTTWSNPVQLTNNKYTQSDLFPSITQDRGGTLWMFWTRNLPPTNSTNPFQYQLFYKNSTNNGVSWSQETPIAAEPLPYNDQTPSVVQGPDKTLWMIWSSTRPPQYSGCCFNLYLLRSSVIPIHDLSVTNVVTSPSNPRTGETLNITVSTANLGDSNETSTVKLYINSTLVSSKPVTLTVGQSTTSLFRWNTTGNKIGRYFIAANVQPVAGETILQNNWFNATSFIITFRGDVNRDGIVNIQDLVIVAGHFGTVRGGGNYLPNADLNNDGVINIQDMVIVAADFGKSFP